MKYTQEEKQKIWENVDKIKSYIQTLQPRIRDRITIDFGEMKTYGMFDRERECHLYVENDIIYGRIGGLTIAFENTKLSSTSSDVYRWLEYTVQLIQNWHNIKILLLEEIERQEATINIINNFEL